MREEEEFCKHAAGASPELSRFCKACAIRLLREQVRSSQPRKLGCFCCAGRGHLPHHCPSAAAKGTHPAHFAAAVCGGCTPSHLASIAAAAVWFMAKDTTQRVTMQVFTITAIANYCKPAPTIANYCIRNSCNSSRSVIKTSQFLAFRGTIANAIVRNSSQ